MNTKEKEGGIYYANRLIVKLIIGTVCSCILFFPATIQSKKVLRAGGLRALPPFAFVDKRSGVYRGFSVDLAKLLAGTTGARIKFHAMESAKLEEALVKGKIDFIIGVPNKFISNTNMQFLEPTILLERKLFVHDCCVTVTCVKDLPGHTVAIEKGSEVLDLIPDKKSIEFIEAESPEKALKLVDSGEADVYISPSGLSTTYFIQKNHFENIKEVGLPIETIPFGVAVRKDSSTLLTELSVAFGKILENKSYDTIYRKWFGQGIQFMEWQKYVKIVIGAVGLFITILLIFVFWTRTLKRKVLKITRDLQRSKQKYKDLIQFSPEMIHQISSDGRIVLANRVALQRLGYKKQEILSLRVSDLVAKECRHELESFIQSVFRVGRGEKEFIFQAKDGRRIHVEMSITTMKGLEDSEELACCFSRDITDRRRLEEELIQSERLAIMGEMAAGIAHEINNPLGIIMANTEEALSYDQKDEGIYENLVAIGRNAERAGKFIDDLLSFTRPAAPSKASINLIELIEESLSLLKQQLKQKRIRVEKQFPEKPVIFEGDDNQIQQLLINLILNSIQAMPQKGRICIRVGLNRINGTEKIRMEIEDTGVGIPEKDLSRIFDPFFTARKSKGFGLGLFISRRIVEKHNGTIRVESTIGQGTIIIIEFPAQVMLVSEAGARHVPLA
ncbi:MAG: transporter substrate-binding domain-containing protein [Deltaproteobacteria bacterium]|nr:transporter substrate-binding domain-containing protein [Deltaproteobacteria bacterium]MBW2307760.1 transporter substrate-binding domain-containing protein [Deltaproteobacteria bacterium]